MRKLSILFAAVFAFVACTQNDFEELTAHRVALPEVLTIGFEGGDDTRIELNEALQTVWTNGDEVSVFYHSDANQQWRYDGETGERVAPLTLVDDGGEPMATTSTIVVVYPYNVGYTLDPESCNIQVTLPATQHYHKDSYGVGDNIMVSSSDNEQFMLKSLCGWLKLQLTGDGEYVHSITLRGNAGEQIAGLADVVASDATISFVADGDKVTTVTLDCGSGVELGAEATAFYIALPPQTFEKGITVEVDAGGITTMTLATKSSVTIERNHIQPMASAEVELPAPPSNQIWYTNGSTTEASEPHDATAFNVNIVSNLYDAEKGCWVITFDGDLTTIGFQAFWIDNSLLRLAMPDSVTIIEMAAFNVCNYLTNVRLSNALEIINRGAFQGCINLKNVKIPDNVGRIDASAFSQCYAMTSITFPDSVHWIGGRAFEGCTALTSVTIGNGVTEIAASAFSDCANITSVTISDSVEKIGNLVFKGCTNLREFKGKYASDNGRCLIMDDTIVAYAIATGTEYTIPDNVTVIGDYVFYATEMTDVKLHDRITTIGTSAFNLCSKLSEITLPESVTNIQRSAFYTWGSLSHRIYCKATTPPALGNNEVFGGCPVYVPKESLELYKEAEYWCDYNNIVGYDFNTGDIVIPDSWKINYTATAKVEAHELYPWTKDTFGVNVVSNEWNETSGEGVIIFDGKVMSVGDYAFYENSSLTGISFPENVETIGTEAFANCPNLVSVTMNDRVTFIGDRAFRNCSGFTNFTIIECVETLGENAFANCTNLTSVTIPDSVKTLRDGVFADCTNLMSVYCKATIAPIAGYDIFINNAPGLKIYVPYASYNDYFEYWSGYTDIIVGYDFETGEVVEETTQA